jgi:hypothetical protein
MDDIDMIRPSETSRLVLADPQCQHDNGDGDDLQEVVLDKFEDNTRDS